MLVNHSTKCSLIGILFTLLLIMCAPGISLAQSYTTVKHEVPLDSAVRYIKNFTMNPSVPNIQSGFFNRNTIEKIFAQNKCMGMRYYYAKLNNGVHTLVVVGVDSLGNDIENGIIAQQIVPCPPLCSTPNKLNGGK